MTSIYASDLAAMFGDPIVAWLFGHTVRPDPFVFLSLLAFPFTN
jgi:hypothetical protein